MVRMSGDTIYIASGLSAPVPVVLGAQQQLQVPAEVHHHTVTGAAIGLFLGGAIGAAVGSASGQKSRCTSSDPFCLDLGRGYAALGGGVVGGGAGLLIGAIIGAATGTATWRPPDR